MTLRERLRALDRGKPRERQSERQAVWYSTAMLLGSVGFLVAEVFGGPYGIAIFPLAVVGGIEAGRVIERRASRTGRGLSE